MSRIKIKNFGPIKEGFKETLPDGSINEWMDIKKVTMFIGNQGSGKSTVAKLVSTLSWIEKALTRGDREPKYFETYNRFRDQYLTYHRIENYFLQFAGTKQQNELVAEIEYQGDSFDFKFYNGNFQVIKKEKKGNYELPQIMYVPSERNFIGSFREGRESNITLDSLREFITDYSAALDAMEGLIRLPVAHVDVEYSNKTVYIKKDGNFRIRLSEASSGFQSLVPMYIASLYMASSVKPENETAKKMTPEQIERFAMEMQSINETPGFTEEQKRIARSNIGKKFNKTAFINIVEEPEQNLFPTSQMEMLYSLLKFNNMNEGNKLIMTTHSPYLVNYLTLAIKAWKVRERNHCVGKNFDDEIEKIVPIASLVDENDWVIYQLYELDGSIRLLHDYKKLPEDNNELNKVVSDINNNYDQLRQIEKQ